MGDTLESSQKAVFANLPRAIQLSVSMVAEGPFLEESGTRLSQGKAAAAASCPPHFVTPTSRTADHGLK